MTKTLPPFTHKEQPGTNTKLETTRKEIRNTSESISVEPKKLNTITGSALMQLELPEPTSVVSGFFVEGLTLLASRPKLGKSWLMLAVALAVTCGGRAFGKIQVDKGEALYIGLEDNPRRLQSRLEVLTDVVPEGLHLATSGAMSRLYEGGLEQLDGWLTEHPDCRLVVIDTLARVRPQRKAGADLYQEDSLLGGKLQELALKHHVALVVVHHVRKALAEDFLDMVSGSTGLTGVADAVLVLTRLRSQGAAVLNVTGRDIEESSHALEFDSQCGQWSLMEDIALYALTKERQTILAYLSRQTEAVSPKVISDGTGLPRGSTRNLLSKLLSENLVKSPERGRYISNDNSDDNGDKKEKNTSGAAQVPVIAPLNTHLTTVTAATPRNSSDKVMTTPVTGQSTV